jgi:DDE superfamily endonuclease
MSREALDKGRITHAGQDGNREFITLLACICADATYIPPALIYKGEPGYLQDTWFDDVQEEDTVYFATSSNGWSCHELGGNWLVNVFDRHTRKKAKNRRRLLVVDGHSSHINMQFINSCDERRILLLVLPPHSTHRLQPLDVSCFSPLARYYTNELNKLTCNSLGHNEMSKRLFWKLFLPSWIAAFSPENVVSAWTKTGLFPFDPEVVLAQIAKPPTPTAKEKVQTPMTGRTIRRFQEDFLRSPTAAKQQLLLKANERLAAEHSIAIHRCRGLEQALQLEKRKRQKGKRLNLVGEEASGAQFFSPERVRAARAFQAQKEAEKQLELDLKAEKKAQATSKRLEKEKEKAERAVKAAEKKQLAAEQKLQKMAEKQARQELLTVATPIKTAPRRLQAIPPLTKAPRKRGISAISSIAETSPVKSQKVVVSTTTRGRAVLRPHRFIS